MKMVLTNEYNVKTRLGKKMVPISEYNVLSIPTINHNNSE